MPDYQEMYLTPMRKTEKAIRILEEAQRECEEMYLAAGDAEEETPEAPTEALRLLDISTSAT